MTTIQTPLGRVQGTARTGYERYAGIRYAKPPIGARRFRAPEPVEPWEGVLDATHYGPSAPQVIDRAAGAVLFGDRPGPEVSEDCLYLNVFTPKADDGRRPVMVWIHGGAYVGGSGDVYHGSSFCRKGDVVVVTLNYRLGALGFLPLDALDPDFAGAGNNGIRDQIEALRWVKRNIASFGGDPDNVTIFGESAGAGSVMALLAAPEAKGLFHKAIAQSPPTGFGPPKGADELCRSFIDKVGGQSVRDLVDAPLEAIMAAQEAVVGAAGIKVDPDKVTLDGSERGFHPVVDGVVIHQRVADALADQGRSAVPLIVGTNRDEGTLFSMLLPLSLTAEDLLDRLEHQVPDAKSVVKAHESRATPGRSLVVDMMTEGVFRIPTLKAIDGLVEAGGKAWVYHFAWPTPVLGGGFGATHALEIPFVFGFAGHPGWAPLLGPTPPETLGDTMHQAWIAFARSGEPGLDWPTYDTGRRPTLVFDEKIRVENDPVGDVRAAWYAEG